MEINFFNEEIDLPNLDFLKLKKWIQKIITFYNKKPGIINYIFCSDDYLLEINQKYLQHNYYTDIISFDYCEEEIISGDIYISIDRVNDNASKYETKDTELYRVIIHGILHYIGLDDHTVEERKEMRSAEDKAIKMLFS